MDRVILHSDMNSFYASVESLYHPELREKPIAVVGDAEQRHGIVLTKNQLAKKYGISTGEAIWQAKQKCPGLVTLPARYDLYMRYSRDAREIYGRYTDRIESFGLDECWLDLSGSTWLSGSGKKVADELRRVIKSELGVTVSVGVSWNKIFAKLGSDYKKPDATTTITRENYKTIVWPLPASDLLYIGRATTRKLARYGIHTIGQLAKTDTDFLRRLLGKWGEYLWSFANGHDISPVLQSDHSSPIKSIGNSMTTHRDIENKDEAWQVLLALAESVCRRLRENGFRCRTVQLSGRDNELAWFECQSKLQTVSRTTQDIAAAAMELLNGRYSFTKPLRSLGVRACDLINDSDGVQLSFGTLNGERLERLESSVDGLRNRFGRDAIQRARLLGADIVSESDPLTHDVHPIGYFGR